MRHYCPDLTVDKSRDGVGTVSEICKTTLDGLGLHYQIRYQSAAHFWAIQIVETAIFLTLTAVLVAVAVLAVTRRRPTLKAVGRTAKPWPTSRQRLVTLGRWP